MSDYIKRKEYKLPNGRTVTADFDDVGIAKVTIQAMDALFDMLNSSQQWIPCSERLPKKDGYYLTTTCYRQVYADYWSEDHFDRTEAVIAWMPLPKPYKQEAFKELHGGKRSLLIDTEPTADVRENVQLDVCPLYGGVCGYPSGECYDCPRHGNFRENVRGEWVIVVDKTEMYDKEGVKTWGMLFQCNQCGFVLNAIEGHTGQYNYCPNCGAEMRPISALSENAEIVSNLKRGES